MLNVQRPTLSQQRRDPYPLSDVPPRRCNELIVLCPFVAIPLESGSALVRKEISDLTMRF